MIFLPQVTILLLTNKDFEGAKKAMDESCKGITFGGAKIIWDEKCTSVSIWNEKIIKDLYKYVDTTHALLIHQDGYIIHPELWKDEWLKYDFCGSPWPLPSDYYSYRDESGKIVRVGNSVGLRSIKLLKLASTRPVEMRHGNNNEDGHYCCWNRNWLESQGCNFMPFEESLDFGKEHELPEHKGRDTFLFHSLS